MKKTATESSKKATSKDTADRPKKTAAPKKPSGKAALKPTIKKTVTPKVSSKKPTTTKKTTTAAKPKKISSKKAEAKKVKIKFLPVLSLVLTSPVARCKGRCHQSHQGCDQDPCFEGEGEACLEGKARNDTSDQGKGVVTFADRIDFLLVPGVVPLI